MMGLGLNLLVCFLILNCVSALFEDQVGKSDWNLHFLGNIQHASFNTAGGKVAVGTNKNVVSFIDLKKGTTNIRHLLEPGARGKIQFLHVLQNKAVVVAGDCSSYVVRDFDVEKGVLLREKHYFSTFDVAECNWSVKDGEVLLFQKSIDGSVHLTAMSLTKDGNKQELAALEDNPAQNNRCAVSSESVVCVDTIDGTLRKLSLDDLSTTEKDSLINVGFNDDDLKDLIVQSVPGLPSRVAVSTGNKVLVVGSGEKKVISVGSEECVWGGGHSDGSEFLLIACKYLEEIKLTLIDLSSGEKVMEGNFRSEVSPSNILPYVTRNPNGEIVNCRYLLTFEDHSVRFATVKGESWWTREEALASILSVEMVDLPVSEREAIIEEEFDSPQDGIISRMAKRITSESYQVFLIFKEVLLGRKTTSSAGLVDRGLVRDKFGFHKVIVVATEANKLFGIDSLSGSIIWSRFVPNFEALKKQVDGKEELEFPLFVLRGSAHHPLTAQVALVGRNKNSGASSIFVFNPITGIPYSELSSTLPFTVKLIHQLWNLEGDNQFIKPLLLLDSEDRPTIYPQPKEGVKLTKPLYLTSGDSLDCSLRGLKISDTTEGLSASLVWSLSLCSPDTEWIAAIAPKRADETVHSQGRPLADRSVLYKYLNPNLLAIVIEGRHPVHKGHVRILLVDSITGNVLYTTTHKRSSGPVHLVHSENWLVYTYYNEKFRRTELVSLELYEGKERTSELVITSFDNIKPMIEKQAFIFPASITALKETITQMGLTNKHILVSVPTRGVLELPRAFLDPRRPTVPTNEAREEGLVPYVPELPIPPEGIINYNNTLGLTSGIHTTPAGLESTCLVFVYGLDLFFTRVMPSKTFDVLKDDFDHLLISTVLFALIAASIVSRRLAAKKALRQAWK